MPKQLIEEALADVKQIKKVAEENALRSLTEAVVPRIREFIDRALLQEDANDLEEDVPGAPGSPEKKGELLSDEVPVPADAITPPDAEGKVTLDIDALCAPEATDEFEPEFPPNAPGPAVPAPMFGAPAPLPDEYELNAESVEALRPLVTGAAKVPLATKQLATKVSQLAERAQLLRKASGTVRATPSYQKQVSHAVSQVEDTYGHVQETVSDPELKGKLDNLLEVTYKVLNSLQEQTTMTQSKKQVNEADLTLKLTGLPDDVEDNLDSVGVDLITGDEHEEGEEGAEGAEQVQGGDQGGEGADLGDLDLGDDEGSEEEQQMETRKLSDDTIVEIDERMLRSEIARMRALREETKPAAWGDGPGGADILDDFGGASDEGDGLDQDVETSKNSKVVEQQEQDDQDDLDEQQEQDLDEQQDDLDEQQDQDLDEQQDADDLDQMYEDDQDLDQLQNRRKEDEYGPAVADGHESATWDKRRHEGVRRLAFEKKLQERAKARAVSLKKEAAKARASRNGKRLVEVKKEYAVVAKRFNESLARGRKMSRLVAVATQKLNEARSNSKAVQPAEKANVVLRKKLAETNLNNAKLLYTNKLLQNETLSAAQKANVVKQLAKVGTVREAKLVYESIVGSSTAPKSLREGADRKVLGSASRTTRPASTSLNEGVETDRWAKLAGLTK